INDPELVILDEPMSGLDPIGRRDVRDLILDLKARGRTVFFSTHILSDTELLCDRVGMLVKGSLKAVGRVADLVRGETPFWEVTLRWPTTAARRVFWRSPRRGSRSRISSCARWRAPAARSRPMAEAWRPRATGCAAAR